MQQIYQSSTHYWTFKKQVESIYKLTNRMLLTDNGCNGTILSEQVHLYLVRVVSSMFSTQNTSYFLFSLFKYHSSFPPSSSLVFVPPSPPPPPTPPPPSKHVHFLPPFTCHLLFFSNTPLPSPLSQVTLQLALSGLSEFSFHFSPLDLDMFQIACSNGQLTQTFHIFQINKQGSATAHVSNLGFYLNSHFSFLSLPSFSSPFSSSPSLCGVFNSGVYNAHQLTQLLSVSLLTLLDNSFSSFCNLFFLHSLFSSTILYFFSSLLSSSLLLLLPFFFLPLPFPQLICFSHISPLLIPPTPHPPIPPPPIYFHLVGM